MGCASSRVTDDPSGASNLINGCPMKPGDGPVDAAALPPDIPVNPIEIKAVKSSGSGRYGSDMDPPDVKRKQNIVRISQNSSYNDERHKSRITQKTDSARDRIFRAIKDSDLLSQFPREKRIGLVQTMYLRNYEEGDVVISKGEVASAFVVVESGSFEIDANNTTSVLSSGDTWGDLHLFHISPSEVTIRAVTAGSIWMITSTDFLSGNSKVQSDLTDNTMRLLKEVPLLQNLTDVQLEGIQGMLQTEAFSDGEYIIRKGEKGNKLYIIKSGEAICDDGDTPAADGDISLTSQLKSKEIRRLHSKEYFGEIALMRDIERTINVISSGRTECWVIRREAFDQILGSLEDILIVNMKRKLLDTIPILMPLSPSEKDQLVESVAIEEFNTGEHIVRQHEKGDKFYIIEKGEVIVNKEDVDGRMIFLRNMGVKDYFGETALFTSEERTANVIASKKTTVLSITRDAFINHLGPLGELLQRKKIEDFLTTLNFFGSITLGQAQIVQLIDLSKSVTFESGANILNAGDPPTSFYIIEEGSVLSTLGDERTIISKGGYFGEESLLKLQPQKCTVVTQTRTRCLELGAREFAEIVQPLLYKLDDLMVDEILGIGGFALVRKVHPKNSNVYFALKSVSKTKLMSKSAQRNIVNEKQLITKIYHPFLTKLITTYQDNDYIYMLEEHVDGGDLRTLMLHQRGGRFSDPVSKFFAAVIIQGLEHLHLKHIVYRDMKPENVMLCSSGYVKIIDFGNAKEIIDRTYSLCGTPDYMAPELWLNEGHGIPCDYWAYGVMLYEFLNGCTPFEYNPNKGQSEQISRIIKGRISYPMHFDSNATDLIRSLLRHKPRQRLGCMKGGCDDIRNHPWFSEINFADLVAMKLTPPYIPSQSYLARCCATFNKMSPEDIQASTVEGKLTQKVWIEGF